MGGSGRLRIRFDLWRQDNLALILVLVMFDALACMIVKSKYFFVAYFTPTSNATEWLVMSGKLFHLEAFHAKDTGRVASEVVIVDGALFPLGLQVSIPRLGASSIVSPKIV